MIIHVATGVGLGFCEMAALNKAFTEAGVIGFNLIPMAPIIPPNSEVVDGVLEAPYGFRAHVVLSMAMTDLPDSYACAALAWAQREDGSGMFAEAHGHDYSRVVTDLNKLLGWTTYFYHSVFHGPDRSVVKDSRTSYIQLEGDYSHACAVVVACYGKR